MKKRIMLLASVYEYGGVSSVIKNILDNLDRESFDVVFLVERLAVRHYPLREDLRFINMDIKPQHGGVQKLVNIFRHLCRLRKTVFQEKPDVIVGFGFTINCLCLLSLFCPSKYIPKTILAEYTEQLFVKQKVRNLKENIFRLIYKVLIFLLYHRADAIVCVSKSLERHIRRLFLIDSKKLNVIYVPVDIRDVKVRSQKKTGKDIKRLPCIGTISRLSVEKGVNYLLEAFLDLTKLMDIRLIIVGEGEERQTLEKMARDFRIEDKVMFSGWVENPYPYLRQMDVFVLSSLYEGFPNVIIESMSCGVPVVASKSVGGIEELIKDEMDGLLVPPKDSKALSSSIYRLLQDRKLRDRLIRQANEKVERFDVTNIVKKYESLMLNL